MCWLSVTKFRLQWVLLAYLFACTSTKGMCLLLNQNNELETKQFSLYCGSDIFLCTNVASGTRIHNQIHVTCKTLQFTRSNNNSRHLVPNNSTDKKLCDVMPLRVGKMCRVTENFDIRHTASMHLVVCTLKDRNLNITFGLIGKVAILRNTTFVIYNYLCPFCPRNSDRPLKRFLRATNDLKSPNVTNITSNLSSNSTANSSTVNIQTYSSSAYTGNSSSNTTGNIISSITENIRNTTENITTTQAYINTSRVSNSTLTGTENDTAITIPFSNSTPGMVSENKNTNFDSSVFSGLMLVAALANIASRSSVYGAFNGLLCFLIAFGTCFLLWHRIKIVIARKLGFDKMTLPIKSDELPVLDSKSVSQNVSTSSAEIMTSLDSSVSTEASKAISNPLIQSSLSIESLISAMTSLGNDNVSLTIKCSSLKRPNSRQKEVEIEFNVPQDSNFLSSGMHDTEEDERTYSRLISHHIDPIPENNDYDYIDDSVLVDQPEIVETADVVENPEVFNRPELVERPEVFHKCELMNELEQSDVYDNRERVELDIDDKERVDLDYLNVVLPESYSFSPFSGTENPDKSAKEYPLSESKNYVNVDNFLIRGSTLRSSLV